jgi:hypothetical protein
VTQFGVAAALERAGAFVETHGDPLQRARAAALRDPAAVAAVDGLLPPVDTPVGAFIALGWLDALRVRRGPRVERSVATLTAVQHVDGAWILGAERDLAGEIATTAGVAGLLAKTTCVRREVLDAAGDWLGARWSPDRVQGGDLRLIAGYASFFANVDHELSDAGLQWCGRELERGFRTGALDALAVARVLVRCDACALPGAQLDAEEIVLSLLAQQVDDGGFTSAVDPPDRVEATLDGITALRRLLG